MLNILMQSFCIYIQIARIIIPDVASEIQQHICTRHTNPLFII